MIKICSYNEQIGSQQIGIDTAPKYSLTRMVTSHFSEISAFSSSATPGFSDDTAVNSNTVTI
jgi:hypothetical protein